MDVLRGLISGASFSKVRIDEHWLVEGLIRPRSVTLVEGDPGSKKTWFALELIRAVASGEKFLGRFPTHQGCCVGLMLDSGMPDLVKQWRRLTAEDTAARADWVETVRREIGPYAPELGNDDLDDLTNFWISKSLDLAEPATVSLLIKDLKSIEHSFQSGGRPNPMYMYVTGDGEFDDEWYQADLSKVFLNGVDLVVIDSLSKVHAGDENDNNHMAQVLGGAARIAEETCAAVVIIHHLAKPSEWSTGLSFHRGRGASSIAASADGILMLEAVKKAPGKTLVHHAKMRGELVPDFYIELRADAQTACLVAVETGDPDQEALTKQARMNGNSISRKDVVAYFRTKLGEDEDSKKVENAADGVIRAMTRSRAWVKEERGVYRVPGFIDLSSENGEEPVGGSESLKGRSGSV